MPPESPSSHYIAIWIGRARSLKLYAIDVSKILHFKYDTLQPVGLPNTCCFVFLFIIKRKTPSSFSVATVDIAKREWPLLSMSMVDGIIILNWKCEFELFNIIEAKGRVVEVRISIDIVDISFSHFLQQLMYISIYIFICSYPITLGCSSE